MSSPFWRRICAIAKSFTVTNGHLATIAWTGRKNRHRVKKLGI